MISVIRAERKSEVLVSSSLACLSHIPAANLTSGCAHGCLYCYARGYRTYPGDDKVVVYENILEKLKIELACKRIKPQSVYFSPSSDIFQPVPEVLQLGYSILHYLLARGIGVVFLTKGSIPDGTLRLLIDYADMIRAQIGFITPYDDLRRVFEPNAASIGVRLRQMKEMIAGGIEVEARLMPILPGITDDQGSLECLLRAIAGAGVKRVAISTLFIRPAIAESLMRQLSDHMIAKKLLGFYKNIGRIEVLAKNSSVIPLPRTMRENIYNEIRLAAKKYDINVSVCGCMNPDLGGSCNIAGNYLQKQIQSSLF